MSESSVKIERIAEDKRAGMTLADAWAFAQDALTHGVDPRAPIKVTTGFRQQIQKLEAGGAG